ncbi:MAG: PAS domain-containing protein [Sphingomicrobium sp.]
MFAHGAILDSIAASPLAMVVTNPLRADNPIEVANDAFCRLTGYAERDILGRNCRFLSDGGGSDPTARAQMKAAIEHKRSVLVDILNYRADGTQFRNGVMIAPLFDDSGKLMYFLGSQVELDLGEIAALSVRQARATAVIGELPKRQREVLTGMASGRLNKQIAYDLGIAEKTAKMHRALLLERLGNITSAEAVRLAVEAGL